MTTRILLIALAAPAMALATVLAHFGFSQAHEAHALLRWRARQSQQTGTNRRGVDA